MADINFGKLKKEHLVLICIILIATIGFFAYSNVFMPLLKKIQNLSIQIDQRKKNIQKAQISPQALKKLEDETGQIKNQIDYYQNRLQTQADVPQILKELNQMAEQLKIKFVAVNPLERTETLLPGGGEFLLQIPIKIKLQCGYHELGIFINQLEKASIFMNVMELQINADPKDIWAHQTEIVITAYSLVSKDNLQIK